MIKWWSNLYTRYISQNECSRLNCFNHFYIFLEQLVSRVGLYLLACEAESLAGRSAG